MVHLQRHVVVPFFVLLDIIRCTDAFQCYSCTYARSFDPRIGYDCVDSPTSNVVARISCAAPYVCKAVVEMDRRLTIIKSVVRNCLPIGQSCQGTTCCNRAGDQPSLWCEQKCEGPLCNDINLEAWLGMEDEEESEEESGPTYVPAHLFDVRAHNDADTSNYYFEWTIICLFVLAIFLLSERST